jgi:CRP/FNR family transcriptional regulator, cyclic AMP receptor protein
MVYKEILGYLAALAVLATFCMKTMQPLRIIGLISNVLFALYGFYAGLYPVLALHIILFPVNFLRLIQFQRLTRQVKAAAASDLSMTSLLHLMHRRKVRAGETVFRKGDIADRLYYVSTGEVSISESGVLIKAGAVFGEIGVFAPSQLRTASIVAVTDAELYELTVAKTHELYFQNPVFGFAILRLIIARLLDNARLATPHQLPRHTSDNEAVSVRPYGID